jgi:hypothetical protein
MFHVLTIAGRDDLKMAKSFLLHSIEYNNLVALGSESVSTDRDLPARHRGRVLKINGNIQYRLGGFVPGTTPAFANLYTLRVEDVTGTVDAGNPPDNELDYPWPTNDDDAKRFEIQTNKRMAIAEQLYPKKVADQDILVKKNFINIF